MICPACQSDNDSSLEDCSHCGKDLYSLPNGHLLSGRYQLVGRLGKGGMGVVYKAHDRELDEVVAIKTLRPDAAASAAVTKRFRGEGKLARTISHPNVCRIHDYGRDGDLAYIVMELVDGVDLKRVLREQGPLPPAAAYDVAIQVAEALQAIHEGGVVHRDLKTPNLMQDERGVVKVMDFGIAKRVEETRDPKRPTTGVTASGQIIGTVEYMSPEQVRAEPLDARSDLYALGIVVFELFTGDVPFRGDSFMATAVKHMQEPLPLDGPLAERIPAALAPVLTRALQKSREARFESAREMAHALRHARAQAPAPVARPVPVRAILSHAPTLVRPTGRAPRTRRWIFAAAATAAVVVALATAYGGRRPATEVVQATAPTTAPTVAPTAEITATPTSAPTEPPAATRRTPAPARLALAALAIEIPAAEIAPTATTPPTPTAEPARVEVAVKPWAEVTLDGQPLGPSPLPVLSVAPGVHVLRFLHPEYQPILRKLTLASGQLSRVAVDFELAGIPLLPEARPQP